MIILVYGFTCLSLLFGIVMFIACLTDDNEQFAADHDADVLGLNYERGYEPGSLGQGNSPEYRLHGPESHAKRS